jgi:two-component system LytT family response regulator
VTDVDRLLACVRELGASPRRGDPTGERIAIRTADSILLLPLGDIEWVEARGDYIRIHSQGRGDLVRETIGGFEQRLPPDRFVRVHRSAIVNLGRVREVRTLPSGEQVAVLQSGVRCRLSRSGRERLGRLVALGN